MKQKILEKLSKLSDYVSKASPEDLKARFDKCKVTPEVAKTYSRLETTVLTSCLNVQFTQNPSAGKYEAGNDYAMAA